MNTMIPAFPASPRHLFRLIEKFDHAFASLLQGKDVETDESLPGFSFGGRKVSTTEKVRIKSLIERTRVSVTNLLATGDFEAEGEESMMDDEDDDMEGDLIVDGGGANDFVTGGGDDWDMDVAKVYDKTLQQIGDSMDGPSIGIRT